jgi:hypothetical protein
VSNTQGSTVTEKATEKGKEVIAALAPKAEAAKESAIAAAGQAKEWAAPKVAEALDTASAAIKDASEKVADAGASLSESVSDAAARAQAAAKDEPAHRRWPKVLLVGLIAAAGAVAAKLMMKRRREDEWHTVEEWEPTTSTGPSAATPSETGDTIAETPADDITKFSG